MAHIKELIKADRKFVNYIVALHERAFPSFFLTQLGQAFLRTLYLGYLEDPDSGIIMAEENGMLVGFIAYSNDYPNFYKRLIKNHLWEFALYSAGAAIRHPSFTKRLLNAFRKSESVEKKEKYVELASICVDPKIENKGVGTQLVDYLKSIVDFSNFEYINLETDAENNDAANKFYMKNGFILTREFITSEGRKMNEYRYRSGD